MTHMLKIEIRNKLEREYNLNTYNSGPFLKGTLDAKLDHKKGRGSENWPQMDWPKTKIAADFDLLRTDFCLRIKIHV